jgi:gas vesicle protein
VSALRKELGKAVPSVQALNREFGFWADLRDVTSASAARKVGQSKTGLIGKTVENTGRAVGGYVGYQTGGVVGATTGLLVGGETAKRLTALFRSPSWKLRTSAQKVRLANALATRNPTTIGDALAALERAQPAVQAAARETVATLPKAADRDPGP